MPKITGKGVASFSGAAPAAPAEKAKGDSPEPQNSVQRTKVVSTPPVPQAGAPKWLAYAEAIGVEVPEKSREDKAAIRALINE